MAILWALVKYQQSGAASAIFGRWQSRAASANPGDKHSRGASASPGDDLDGPGEVAAGLIGDGGEARAKHNKAKKIASRRYFVTENEARANQYNGEKIERIELDEVEARQAAANWLNHCESMRARAIKREANKTAKERSDNMKKAWVTRKAKS